MTDLFYPWLTDPDDPADIPIPADPAAAAKAIFAMFPELVDHSNDGPLARAKRLKILDATLAEWAARFAAADAHRIETAIRTGLLSGMENTEVARQVVGSQRLAGVDGVTEITRRHIAHLARVTLKRRK